ncbi:hypothetical protein BDF19DRAFT_456526, partial [Syncephalis fuscata]
MPLSRRGTADTPLNKSLSVSDTDDEYRQNDCVPYYLPPILTYIANIAVIAFLLLIYVLPPTSAPWPISMIQHTIGLQHVEKPFWLLALLHLTEAYIVVVICRRRGYRLRDTLILVSSTLICGIYCLFPLVGRPSRPEYFTRLPWTVYVMFILLANIVIYAYLTPIASHFTALHIITATMGERLVASAYWVLIGTHASETLFCFMICFFVRGYHFTTTLKWTIQTAVTGMNGMHLLFQKH